MNMKHYYIVRKNNIPKYAKYGLQCCIEWNEYYIIRTILRIPFLSTVSFA